MEQSTTGKAPESTGKVITLTRVFQFGSLRLADPDPSLPPEEALRLYASAYPVLTTATLDDEPRIEGNEMVYVANKASVKTKG